LLVSLEESHSIQTSRLRATSSKGSSCRFEHTLNHRKLERDLQLTHHAQEPSIGFLHRNPIKKLPLGTAIFLRSTQRSTPTNFIHAGKLSCGANNHHNCRHRIIIPLNTRTFGQLYFTAHTDP
jgi:hypothetical protein